MPRPAKVTRASKATREKIIKAASRAFALNGYEGASIRTIVAEADVNQAAINYHFGSKEGLYRAVLQDGPARADERGRAEQRPAKLLARSALRQLRAPAAAADDLARRAQRLRARLRLGNAQAERGLSQIHGARGGTFLCRRDRVGPSLSAGATRPTSRRSSPRCGCSGNATFSCATPSSWPIRRCGSKSTNASWTASPRPSPLGQQTV